MRALTIRQPWCSLVFTWLVCSECKGAGAFTMRTDYGTGSQDDRCLACDGVGMVTVKWIETRTWAAPSLVGETIALHAGSYRPRLGPIGEFEVTTVDGREGLWARKGRSVIALPLGAVMGTARVRRIVPIAGFSTPVETTAPIDRVLVWPDGKVARLQGPAAYNRDEERHLEGHVDVDDQLPYGDFRAGNFAWVLDEITTFAEPVPARGGQRVWHWPRS